MLQDRTNYLHLFTAPVIHIEKDIHLRQSVSVCVYICVCVCMYMYIYMSVYADSTANLENEIIQFLKKKYVTIQHFKDNYTFR